MRTLERTERQLQDLGYRVIDDADPGLAGIRKKVEKIDTGEMAMVDIVDTHDNELLRDSLIPI
jgi:hypothetical protein